jgi:ATP-dependent DNA ligase
VTGKNSKTSRVEPPHGNSPPGEVFGIPLDTPPMEARSADALPESGGPWQYEPKWDGFRCLAFKAGGAVELRAKSGKPLGRYFPEVVSLLGNLAAEGFVLDGELVIEIEGRLAFDTLQMRLHPAESRIRKLSTQTPAGLILFDMLLAPSGIRVMDQPLKRRRRALEAFAKESISPGILRLSSYTRDRKQAERWLVDVGHNGTDGVVAKRLDGLYEPGERAMIKVKRLRTADCVVGGFRYESDSHEVGSLLLGLYDDEGKLNHVGFTATISNAERRGLTRRLEALCQPPVSRAKRPVAPAAGTQSEAENGSRFDLSLSSRFASTR